jgi:DNA-binding response OmpR family regulator
MKRILIVEDDPLIADLERDYLEANGFENRIASNGAEGLRAATDETWDLILLDVMLPGISGFEVCRELRKEQTTPVIMVTARKSDVDKIRGLGLGADDYVVKPFSPSELVARVQAHIRIHETLKKESAPPAEEVLEIRGLKIRPLSRQVFVDGREVFMPNKEFELLYFLARHPNIVFSKEKLFDRIWGMEAIGDVATVTVHINRIREKIEKDTANPEYIETVWGAGYRFRI